MNLTGAVMVILGYIIGHMFGQMSVKEELKEQGIIFESKKPSLIFRIIDIFATKAKNPPSRENPQNINQVPPVPENRNNVNNFKK